MDPDGPVRPFTEDEQQRVIEALTSRGVDGVCPMCKTERMNLLGTFIANIGTSDLTRPIPLGVVTFPCIAAACDNCGFVSQHLAATLGLVPFGAKVV